MKFAERLKLLRKKKQLSQTELGHFIKKSKSIISMYENGSRTPSFETQEAIADFFNVDLDYLRGRSDIPSQHFLGDNLNIEDISNLEPMPDTEKKPLLGAIACGEPILAEENIEDYVNVPKVIKCDFLLTCKGNSMINLRVYDGDLVCVKQQPTVENGEVAAVLIDDEATLKRFNQYGDTVVLKAENPDFPDIVLNKSDAKEIRIIGKATHYISKIK